MKNQNENKSNGKPPLNFNIADIKQISNKYIETNDDDLIVIKK